MRDPTTSAGVASLKAGAQLARVVPSGKPVSTFVQLADDETQLHLRAKAKSLRKGAREAVRLTDVLDLFVGQESSGASDGLALSLWMLPTSDDEIGEKIDLLFDDAEVFGLWLVTLRALLVELRPPEPPSAATLADEEVDREPVPSAAAANPWDDQPEPAEAGLGAGAANPFGEAPATPAAAVHASDEPPSSSNPFEEEIAAETAAGETSPSNPFVAAAAPSPSLTTSGAATNPFEAAAATPTLAQAKLRKKKSAKSVAKAAVAPPAAATTSTNPFAAEVEEAEKGVAQASTNPFAIELVEGDGSNGAEPPAAVVQEQRAEPTRRPRAEARRRFAASQLPLPEEMPLKLLAYELLLLSLAADGEEGGGGARIGEGVLEGLRTRLDVSWRQHRELMPLLQPPDLAGRGEGRHPAGPAHRLALLRAASEAAAAAADGAKDAARRRFVERQSEVLEYVLAARGHPGAAEGAEGAPAALESMVRPPQEAGEEAEATEGGAWLAGGWPWQLSFALLCSLVRAALFEEGLDGEPCACADAPGALQLIQATCWAPLGVDARAQALATARVTWEAYEAGGGADELRAARERLKEVLWEHAAVARIAMASAVDATSGEAAPATAVAAASTIQRAWRRWLTRLGSEAEAGAGWAARLRGTVDGLEEALAARLHQRLRSLEPLDELPLCVSTLQLAVSARVALGSAAARHAPLALETLLMADGGGGGGSGVGGGGGLMGDEGEESGRLEANATANPTTAVARVEARARAEVARVAVAVLRGSVPPQLARLRAMLDDEGDGAGGEPGGGGEEGGGGGGGGGGGVQNAVRGWKDADEDVSEAQIREEQREAARRAAGATRLEGWLEKRRGGGGGGGGGGFGRGGRGGSAWDRRYVVLLPDRLCWGGTAEAWASQAQDKQLLLTPATVVTLEGPHLTLATAGRLVVLRAAAPVKQASASTSDASERASVSSVSAASERASAQPLQPWAEAIHARVVERALGTHRGDAAKARAARELARVLCDEVEIEPEFTRPFGGLLAAAGGGGGGGGGGARLARGRCDALATTLEEMQRQLLGIYGARAALASFNSLSGDVIKTVAALGALKLRLEQLLRAEALAAAADAADDDAEAAHATRRVSVEAAQAEEVGIGREAFAELPRLCVGIAHGFTEGVERRLGQTLPRALAEETWEGLGATGVSSSVVDVFRSLSDCVSMHTDFALAASLHRGAALAAASKPFLEVIGRLVADYAARLVAEARKGGGSAEGAAGGASAQAVASVQVARGAPPKKRGLLGCCGRGAAKDVLEQPPREAGFAAEAARATPEAVEAAEARRRRLGLILNQLGWAEQQVAHLADRMAKQLPAITALPEASLPGARAACASAACSVVDELVQSQVASLAPQLATARRAAEAGGAPARALTAALRRANLLLVEVVGGVNPPWRRAALLCCLGTTLAQLEPARVGGAPSAPPQERRGLVMLGDADVAAIEQGLAASGAPLDVDVVHALHEEGEATRAERSQQPSRSAACVSRLDEFCKRRVGKAVGGGAAVGRV